MNTEMEVLANEMREMLKDLEIRARFYSALLKDKETKVDGDRGEVIAQSIIAMRNIEDARMRYGKVIQYLNDGVSKYDK